MILSFFQSKSNSFEFDPNVTGSFKAFEALSC